MKEKQQLNIIGSTEINIYLDFFNLIPDAGKSGFGGAKPKL